MCSRQSVLKFGTKQVQFKKKRFGGGGHMIKIIFAAYLDWHLFFGIW